MALCPQQHDEEARIKRVRYGLGINDMMKSGKLKIKLMREAIQILVKNGHITQAQLREFAKAVIKFAKSNGLY